MNTPTPSTAGTLQRRLSGMTLGFFCCTWWLSGIGAAPAFCQEAQDSAEVLDLPLERLMDVSVISASRKSQSLSDVSSAVFVINQEDIRHSGATTIPDLLRMVPGVQVASIDGNSWAVSIRGFNGTFANKLLVMIDGRSVYTPLYGGVFWDVQDTLFDNIERIEVIRGSGSTMWGANAVNGVINIITKNSQDTKGALLTGTTGSHEHATVGARYGATLGDSTNYRLYLKHVDRGDTVSSLPADDSLRVTRGGFRVDSAPSNSLNLTLQGDAYGGTVGNSATVTSLSQPAGQTLVQPTDLFGANILSRFDFLQSEASKFSLQVYYDRTERKRVLIKEDRDTVDLDLQHTLRFGPVNELTWGAGYRFLHDQAASTDPTFVMIPTSRSEQVLNLFLQDEITLLPDTLRFVIGSKVEHNEFTGWELEPSARLSWIPLKGYSLWAAVTRSVRTPARSDQDVRLNLGVIPATPGATPPDPSAFPTVIVITGNPQLKAESLLAYECGLRGDLSETVSLDSSFFYNQYRDIIDPQSQTPFFEGGQVTVPLVFTNLHPNQSAGGELSVQWQPLEWWKLKGGYAYIHFFGDGLNNSLMVKATPNHQATLRSMFALGRDVDFDLWGRYVGANLYPLFAGDVQIPAYFTLDARLAWRPMPGVELSLVGQNLLAQRHLEAVSDLTVVRHDVERTVYGKVSWAF